MRHLHFRAKLIHPLDTDDIHDLVGCNIIAQDDHQRSKLFDRRHILFAQLAKDAGAPNAIDWSDPALPFPVHSTLLDIAEKQRQHRDLDHAG